MAPFAIPAVTSGRLRTFRCFDFSGGIDLKTAKTKLPLLKQNNRLTQALNVVFSEDGSVLSRRGFTLTNADNDLTLDSEITGGVHFRKSDGTSQVIVAAGTKLYSLDLTGTTVANSIKTGLTATYQAFFATYNDTLFIANGADVPMQYDGTTVTALGGSSPNTMHVVVAHANRLFATATAVPSRLYWSKLNNPTDWSGTSDAGFMDINPNDGFKISALVSSNQELIIMKENRPYRLQGIGPTTGYTVVDHLLPATGSIGTPWPAAAVWAGNDVFYVSREGVHQLSTTDKFGGLVGTFVSNPVEPYFRSTATAYATDPTPFNQAFKSTIAYNAADDCLYVPMQRTDYVYEDATTGPLVGFDIVLVYDRVPNAWAVWQLGNNNDHRIEITAVWPYRDSTTRDRTTLMWALYDVATNKRYIATQVTPGGTTVTDVLANGSTTTGKRIAEHVSCLGAPGLQKSPRYLYLYFAEGGGTVTVDIFYDLSGTAAISTTVATTSTVDTSEEVIVKRINLSGVCDMFSLRVTGFGTFYGYEVHWRPRRDVDRAE